MLWCGGWAERFRSFSNSRSSSTPGLSLVSRPVAIPRADAGQAQHRPNTLLANLPRRAVRQFADIRRSQADENQIDAFASRRCVFHRERAW